MERYAGVNSGLQVFIIIIHWPLEGQVRGHFIVATPRTSRRTKGSGPSRTVTLKLSRDVFPLIKEAD